MLQEEPLQPLALEPLTEEEQVGQAQAGPGTGQHCGWVSGAGGWVGAHCHPGSLLRETSPCQ